MGQPVVHFEIIGKDPAKLRSYFGQLFGWEFDLSSPVAAAVYGASELRLREPQHDQRRHRDPRRRRGHFTDPEGNLIGVAGTS
jgi:predicted enzyme related to lactoylglutathione lyase